MELRNSVNMYYTLSSRYLINVISFIKTCRELIKKYPDLALTLMNQLVVTKGDEQEFDFTPFEFPYYAKNGNSY